MEATGEGLTYQWFRNGDPIADADEPSLPLGEVSREDVGVYVVEVGDGNRIERSEPASIQFSNDPAGPVAVDAFGKLFAAIGPSTSAPVPQARAPGARTGAEPLALMPVLATATSGTQTLSTFGATRELEEPDHCEAVGGASYWFAYRAGSDGRLTIDTEGSDFDTLLAVYLSADGDLDGLESVACDRDSGSDGQDSSVTFHSIGGTIYYIAVDGVGGATGIAHINYRLAGGEVSFSNPTIDSTGRFSAILEAPAGHEFSIDVSVDLEEWIPIITTFSPDGVFEFIAPDGNEDARYFRARLGTPAN